MSAAIGHRRAFLSLLTVLALTPAQAIAGEGTATTATATPADGASPAPAQFDKELTKELGKGELLVQMEAKNKYPKSYVLPESATKAFATATVGPAMAYEIAHGTNFANAAAAQALCQQILDRLLEGWKGPRPQLQVVIQAEPYYHGEARPSGLMVISLGTFNADKGVTSEDELALLIAHELSHVLLGHLDDAQTMQNVTHLLELLAQGFLTYSDASKSHMVGKQLQIEGDPRLYRRGLLASLATDSLLQDLLAPSFGRGKELEADRLGIDLARRAGYYVGEAEMRSFVGHHTADQAQTSRRMAALGTVLDALVSEASGRIAAKVGGKSAMQDQLSKLFTLLGEKAVKAVVKHVAELSKRHPDPEERMAFLASYLKTNYPGVALGPTGKLMPHRVAGVEAIGKNASVQALVSHVQNAEEVEDNLLDTLSDQSGAQTDTTAAAMLKKAGFASTTIATTTASTGSKKKKGAVAPKPAPTPGFADDNAAYTWHMQGVLWRQGGDDNRAIQSWRNGLRSSLASVELGRELGRNPYVRGDAAMLDVIIAHYRTMLGTDDPVLDLQVAAAMARGDVATAEVTAARCVTFDNGSLYQSCVGFLGYDPLLKETPPKTPEGAKAFIGKSFAKTIQVWSSLTSLF